MATRGRGQPTKYKKRYAEDMIKFFSIEPSQEIDRIHTDRRGNTHTTKVIKPNRLPTFERFATEIGVHTETLKNWADATKKDGMPKHPEFFWAYKKCKDLQKDFLIQNGLTGLFSSHFTIFVATNITDMSSKQSVDHTTKGEKLPTPLLGGTTKDVSSNDSNE